jgi:putative flippase GtrA
VGITSLICEYASFGILYYILHLGIGQSQAISFFFGLVVGFALNRAWTFKSGNYHHQIHSQFLQYAALGGLNLILSVLLIKYILSQFMPAIIAKACITVMITCWNYVIMKKRVFKEVSNQT